MKITISGWSTGTGAGWSDLGEARPSGVAASRFVSSVAYRTRHSNRRKLPVASEQLYQPSDLLRFVDLGGGALVPGSSAVVYAANTLDGETASKDTALWLADSGEQRRLAPADAAQSRPSVSPD